jgi:hypothetical protein
MFSGRAIYIFRGTLSSQRILLLFFIPIFDFCSAPTLAQAPPPPKPMCMPTRCFRPPRSRRIRRSCRRFASAPRASRGSINCCEHIMVCEAQKSARFCSAMIFFFYMMCSCLCKVHLTCSLSASPPPLFSFIGSHIHTPAHSSGTKSFHNFTIKRRHDDASTARYIKDVRVLDTFEHEGVEFVRILVHGQSFMLHQVITGQKRWRSILVSPINSQSLPGQSDAVDNIHQPTYTHCSEPFVSA